MADGSLFSIFNKSKSKHSKEQTKTTEKEKKRKYENESRKRNFRTSWLDEFPWLEFDKESRLMKCKICLKFENNGSFVTGSHFFRKDSVKAQVMRIHSHTT